MSQTPCIAGSVRTYTSYFYFTYYKLQNSKHKLQPARKIYRQHPKNKIKSNRVRFFSTARLELCIAPLATTALAAFFSQPSAKSIGWNGQLQQTCPADDTNNINNHHHGTQGLCRMEKL
jgi:hypothetical protein